MLPSLINKTRFVFKKTSGGNLKSRHQPRALKEEEQVGNSRTGGETASKQAHYLVVRSLKEKR